MKEFKGTKGEWQIVEHSWSDTSIVSQEKTICTNSIYEESTEDTQDGLESEMSANFKIIAAAPDLLKALQILLAFYQSDGTDDFHNVDVEKLAQQAIDKALV